MKNWQRLLRDSDFKRRLLLREQINAAVREFFQSRQYHEVETPLLVAAPGAEPYLNLFTTQLELPTGQRHQAYLLTSPEYALKKLLAAGLGNIFEICKSFRNQESLGGTHNPEFTILEFYRVGADYQQLMDEFADLLRFIAERVTGQTQLTYQGRVFDLRGEWPRFSIAELFAKHLDIGDQQLFSTEALRARAMRLGYELDGLVGLSSELQWEELYNQLFLNEIEPQLTAANQPVIVYDYPAPQAALARKKASDPRFAERFEVYLAGMELGNAFGELTDAAEQQQRLEADLELRRSLGKADQPIDYDFIAALRSGVPACSGMAVGMDRLVMLWANVTDIDQVLFFPASQLFIDDPGQLGVK